MTDDYKRKYDKKISHTKNDFVYQDQFVWLKSFILQNYPRVSVCIRV